MLHLTVSRETSHKESVTTCHAHLIPLKKNVTFDSAGMCSMMDMIAVSLLIILDKQQFA